MQQAHSSCPGIQHHLHDPFYLHSRHHRVSSHCAMGYNLSRGAKGDQEGIKGSACSCNASTKRAIILSSTIALQQTRCKGTPWSIYSCTRCLNHMCCQHNMCSVRRMQARATHMKILCSPSFLPRSTELQRCQPA